MGCPSSRPLQQANSPLQEMQLKESRRERKREQQEKEQKQIVRLRKKHMKRQYKTKRKQSSSPSQVKDQQVNSHASEKREQESMYKKFRCADSNSQLERKMQKQLNEDLCEFILNQMALSAQFFKHYERELSLAAEQVLHSEQTFNENLEEHSILLTNPLDMAVSKWICYKPLHGPEKHKSQLLQTQTMYVVFENIDIARPHDANYDSISPLCKVDIELDFRESTPCKEDYMELLNNTKWKGYVRLRLREDSKQTKSIVGYCEDVYSEGSSGYGTTSPYSSRTILNASENVTHTQQEYDYAFITQLNTQHPLKELTYANKQEERSVDAKVLPQSCISSLGSFIQSLQEPDFTDDEDDETDCEDSDDSNGEPVYGDCDTLQAIKLYKMELERRRKLLNQNYINSHEFMKYFGELVYSKLAAKLNITEAELEHATYRGMSIHTYKYEMIPAIYAAQNVSDWPKCAFEFRLRDRPVSTNHRTGQQIQWPTAAMIKRIETFGFHVIPIGYAPKRRRNPFREIEWRIVFPKAERYLEQHLTSAQVKVFMITKALIKSFVEPVENNKALMFALDHLRMHLFWECERDYNAWPEEFLGEVLLRFVNSFKQRVKEKQLSDYFIRDRNLFESVPEYSLNTLYTILADVAANPVMHLMIAFRNLQFQLDYFPKLDFKRLYDNLVENNMVKLKMLAKNARCLRDLEQDHEHELAATADETAKGLVGLKQHQVRTNGKLRRKTHLLKHNIEIKKQEMLAKRHSVESIDVEFIFKRNIKCSNPHVFNMGVENLRRTNILETVLDHLLEMAAKAIEFKNVVTATSYLSQARRLCKSYHNYGCDVAAKEYLVSIHELDEQLQITYDNEDFPITRPSLPRRISMEGGLPAVPPLCLEKNAYNLYEEMEPQKRNADSDKTREEVMGRVDATVTTKCLETRKSLKMHNVFDEAPSAKNSNSQKTASLKLCHSRDKIKSPESRKSIKFQDTVTTVNQGDLSPIQQKPLGYSPISILRTKLEPKENNHTKLERETEGNLKKNSLAGVDSAYTDKQTFLRNKLKSTTDFFLGSSSIESSELLQKFSQNANELLDQITTEQKKAEIRQMLKRKTLQLKGVFDQSSDT